MSRFTNSDPGGWGPNALRYHRAAVNVVCDDVFVVLKVAVVEVALSVDVALAVGVIFFKDDDSGGLDVDANFDVEVQMKFGQDSVTGIFLRP